ncbi:ankyrin repeat domain-containing protein 50-like [Haliotis rufescens]|uniref:ankyrin repeat domain-containing protein 50-like n=1 Tax=Haliotis rufescens TaxID=6454 RepID=UPI00201EF22F|nr:ankyrin repeat domain-containing protein 50-like [Haliotis rufescens]
MRPQSASALLRGPPLCLSDVMKMGYLQQVRDLVDLGMDIDSRDVDGKTPLMLCALMEPESWGTGIARHLIENGADLKLRDKAGLNALHYACIYERDALTKVFLHAIDFDLNQADKHGNTALHYCVQSGNVEMVKLLVEHLQRYGLSLEMENRAGVSARSLAQKLPWMECVQLLTEREKEVEEEEEETHTEIEKYEVRSERNEMDDVRSQKDETYGASSEKSEKCEIRSEKIEKYEARSEKNEKYEVRSEKNEKYDVRSEKSEKCDIRSEQNEKYEARSEKNEKCEVRNEKGEKDEISSEKSEKCELSSQKSVLSLSLTESNLKSFSEEASSMPQPQRPKTALLKRRRASSVSSASSLSSGGRSQASTKSTPRNKTPKRCLLPNAKNEDSIIRCVSMSDFRKTKEYVFKLTAVPYDELEMERGLPSIRRPQSAWTPRREAAYQTDTEPFSWRTEFKKLYVEYEFQCSPSWRDAAKTIADQLPLTPPSPLPQPEEAEEDKVKDRKGRRSSLVKSQLSVESFKDKRRASGNIKLRKLSTSGIPTPHMKGMDGALASSSESLNSSNSSKKKDGLSSKGDITASKNHKMTPPDKDVSVKGPKNASLSIPAVTETLVGDSDNDNASDGALTDSNRLSVLSDIDEDS